MIFYLIKYSVEYYLMKLLPLNLVKKIQLHKFNKLIKYALKYSTFYQKIYENIDLKSLNIKTVEDLEKLPIITKEMMNEYAGEQIVTSKNIEGLIIRSTSGSTGKPFDTYLTKKEYFTSYFRTFFSLKNYNPFSRFVLVGVFQQKEEIEKKSFLHFAQKYLKLFRREAYSVFTPVNKIIKNLRDKKIHILSTTPSFLKILTEELARQDLTLNIKYVIPFGETLFSDVRNNVKEYLHAQIINVYGSMELPTLAWTLPDADTFQYPLNSVILEYVNPINIDGETYGELVITNLVNKTMPFIRYKISDHVKILENDYLNMGTVIGRIEDVITLDSGERLFRLQIYSLFNNFSELKQYKIIQKKDNKIYFQVILKENIDADNVEKKINQLWRNNFQSSPPEVQFLESFFINKNSGKFKNIEIEK